MRKLMDEKVDWWESQLRRFFEKTLQTNERTLLRFTTENPPHIQAPDMHFFLSLCVGRLSVQLLRHYKLFYLLLGEEATFWVRKQYFTGRGSIPKTTSLIAELEVSKSSIFQLFRSWRIWQGWNKFVDNWRDSALAKLIATFKTFRLVLD